MLYYVTLSSKYITLAITLPGECSKKDCERMVYMLNQVRTQKDSSGFTHVYYVSEVSEV